MSEKQSTLGRGFTAHRFKRVEENNPLIEGEVAHFLREHGLMDNPVSFKPLAEFIKDYPTNFTAVALPSGRTLAVSRQKDRTIFSTSGQAVH